MCVVAVVFVATLASGQEVAWVRQFANNGVSTNMWVSDVKVAGGFVYTAGTISAYPVIDGFVRKCDLTGNLVWSRQFGTSGFEAVTCLCVEGSEVFVGGMTTGAFPGHVDSTPFVPDTFVRRYDLDGNEVATIQIPRLSTSSSGTPYPAFIDASGIYGTDIAGDSFPSNEDVLVFKYDHAGNLIWSVQIGTPGNEQGSAWPRSLSVDSTGVFVTGSTQGAFPGQVLGGYADAFVARLDLAGNLLWVVQTGAPDLFSWGSGVVADGAGVYVTGTSTTWFGDASLFVSRYDLAGVLLWTAEIAAGAFDTLYSAIAADASGVYLATGTEGDAPGYLSAGGRDVFIRKFDPSGIESWTVQFGSSGADDAYAVCLAGSSVLIGGSATGPLPTQTVMSGAFVAMISEPALADVDGDGLADSDETLHGTDPLIPDTDGDGILDGPEVVLAGGTGCPSPIDADSDDDGLLDGAEIEGSGTSPCLADTDGDALPDDLDPHPLVAGAASDVLAMILREMADSAGALPLDLFPGPNNQAKRTKRTNLAALLDAAADELIAGNEAETLDILSSLSKKVDGMPSPPDWLASSPQKVDMASTIGLLITLIES